MSLDSLSNPQYGVHFMTAVLLKEQIEEYAIRVLVFTTCRSIVSYVG